ncbi:MAG: MarC family protein [Deltaproteobacteria bacterium]|nr:MarC family protein [Deltaproteobacteria bacterium]
MSSYTFFVNCFVSLFVIVNPIGAIPIFISITEGDDYKKKNLIAKKASINSFIVLIIFTFFGEYILKFFGITIPAFEIGGGIILFMISLEMLQATPVRVKTTPEEEEESGKKADVSLMPLAIPILSGPGAITTVLVFSGKGGSPFFKILVVIAVAATAIITYITLKYAVTLSRIMGKSGINLMNRILGLILAVTSAQFVIDGIKDVLPLLSK